MRGKTDLSLFVNFSIQDIWSVTTFMFDSIYLRLHMIVYSKVEGLIEIREHLLLSKHTLQMLVTCALQRTIYLEEVGYCVLQRLPLNGNPNKSLYVPLLLINDYGVRLWCCHSNIKMCVHP